MAEHVCECKSYTVSGEGWDETIVCSKCFTPPPLSEQVSMLNEYETLKAATERLSAEIVLQNIIIYGEGGFVTDRFLSALKAYADALAR